MTRGISLPREREKKEREKLEMLIRVDERSPSQVTIKNCSEEETVNAKIITLRSRSGVFGSGAECVTLVIT